MKQKIFVVCDLEENYAFRMAEYISDKIPMSYKLHIFTQIEKLKTFLEQNKISILLIAESAMRKLKVNVDIPNVFVLQESEEIMETDYQCINKFQSPEEVVKEMAEQITELGNWQDNRTLAMCKSKLIGIYSPVKRCLQTSFALTMGQLLSKEHKALYMNFECYSGFSRLLHREFSADMMDMVYYFRCAREKFAVRLPYIVQNINGLDFIPPGQSNIDMQAITGENWLELLEAVEEICDYEYLILDLTDGMNGLFELLSNCHKIYTITKDDGFAMAKMKQYEEILQLNEMDDILGKTVKCRFPFFKKLPEDLKLMTHGEFAGYVKAIIQEDLYEKQTG